MTMKEVGFKIEKGIRVTLVYIDLKDGLITPSDLSRIVLPDLVAKGCAHLPVVLSGRAPIWLYLALGHHFHVCAAVASHDPRLGERVAVVVQSHCPDYCLGDLIRF
jgi:CRISPR-associated protein Csx3